MTKQGMRILGFMILAASSSFSQVDSALGYFPLNVGDVWQYHYHYNSGYEPDTVSSYFVKTVSGDTLMPNGKWYKIVNSSWLTMPSVAYLRVDSSDASVYRYAQFAGPSSEEKMDSLAASAGDTVSDNGWPLLFCITFDSSNVLGKPTFMKQFQTWILPPSYHTLAYGFGLVQRIDHGEAPSWGYNIYTDLVYAKINGVDYGTVVSARDEDNVQPRTMILYDNYPNPFNPETVIRFQLPVVSEVWLAVYDILGREVAVLVNEKMDAGVHEVKFDASGLASGVYFYRMQSGKFVQTKKLLLVR